LKPTSDMHAAEEASARAQHERTPRPRRGRKLIGQVALRRIISRRLATTYEPPSSEGRPTNRRVRQCTILFALARHRKLRICVPPKDLVIRVIA